MQRQMEIYNEMLNAGVMLHAGSYHLGGDTDALTIKMDERFAVFLDIEKIRTAVQELEATSHEWAHIEDDATYGVDAPYWLVQRAETKAERSQIRRIVPFDELQSMVVSGQSEWEIAEQLCVSVPFLRKAIEYYTGPCGLTFRRS